MQLRRKIYISGFGFRGFKGKPFTVFVFVLLVLLKKRKYLIATVTDIIVSYKLYIDSRICLCHAHTLFVN